MIPPSPPPHDHYASPLFKNGAENAYKDTLKLLGNHNNLRRTDSHLKDNNCNLKYPHPSHFLESESRCEGNGAFSLDRRMNTDGLERGAMTGSSTTTASESAPWGTYPQNIITTSRPHRPLEPGALDRRPAPPLQERSPIILPSSAIAAQDVGVFRPPLAPASPSARIFPHEQYPTFTSSPSPSLYTPSPLYPQFPSTYYSPSYPYPGTSTLNLGGPPFNPQVGYAELLVRMREVAQLPPSGSRSMPGSSQQMHLSHPPPMSAIRDSPGPRLPLHPRHSSGRYNRDAQSRSPEERDMGRGPVSSPFRHPILPPPLRNQPVKVDSSGFSGQYHRPSVSTKIGPPVQAHGPRVPQGYPGHLMPSDLSKYTGHERTLRDMTSPKRPRMGEDISSSTALYHTHSVTSTITTSTVPTSAQSSLPPDPAVSSQPHYPLHFMKGSVIQLANGALKHVEDLRTEDFVSSADISPDLKIDSSQVVHIEEVPDKGTVILGFSVGEQKLRVTVEATVEHPFFVFGQGWSSCSPEKTQQRYGLQCFKLVVGDICISLTQRQNVSSTTSSRIELNGQHGAAQSRPPETMETSSPRPPSQQSQHSHSEKPADAKEGSFHVTTESGKSGESNVRGHSTETAHFGEGSFRGTTGTTHSSESSFRGTTGTAQPSEGSFRVTAESVHHSGSRDSPVQESESSSQYVSVDSPPPPPCSTSVGEVHSPVITSSSRGGRWSASDQASGDDAPPASSTSPRPRHKADVSSADLDKLT